MTTPVAAMKPLKRPLTVIATVLVLLLACAESAGAITDSERLAEFGGGVDKGHGAGQLWVPGSSASNSDTGRLFVADGGNHRVSVFSAWGEFIMAWGWGVLDGNDELETCTVICQEGIAGDGKGQLGVAWDIAVDGAGDVYVLDLMNNRVQKFTSTGEFILMFGGGVNKTTGGDVCTAASGDECGAGSTGTDPGEFSLGAHMTLTPTGDVLVSDDDHFGDDVGRIQEFDSTGSFEREFEVDGTAIDLATAPDGTIYVIYSDKNPFSITNKADVYRFDPEGNRIAPPISIERPKIIAVGTDGHLFVVRQHENNVASEQIFEFDPAGAEVGNCCAPKLAPGAVDEVNATRYEIIGLGVNSAGDLYVSERLTAGSSGDLSQITLYGPPPLSYGPPPSVPPRIEGQSAISIDSSSAIVRAQINPNFWSDTRYYVEYGPDPCSSSSCAMEPLPPGDELGSGAVKKVVTTGDVQLSGLDPDTTYYYRFVAESGGGGPVRGVGGEVGADGEEGSFHTFPEPETPEACPNQAFRPRPPLSGPPDCRAYEMVSPVDKENGDILTRIDILGYQTSLNQASLSGDAVTFSSYRAFGGPLGAPFTSQYLARRGADGWGSETMSGPLISNFYDTNGPLSSPTKAFTANLCTAFVAPGGDPPLASGAVPGFPNLYRRENCPVSYQALTTVAPPSLPPNKYVPELQGFSADGVSAVFRTADNLTADAPAQPQECSEKPTLCENRVYQTKAGSLSYVCVFPAGTPVGIEEELSNCSAGSPSASAQLSDIASAGRMESVDNAMSDDGSRIYWSASRDPVKVGRIYVRLNGSTTVKVSETQTTKPARFWEASQDGSKALFQVEDPGPPPLSAKDQNLYLFDLSSGTSSLVAEDVVGVAAASDDLSKVYFVSTQAIAGTSGATAKEPNLYLYDGSGSTFIATLANPDVVLSKGGDPGLNSDVSTRPVFHVAAATPDGSHLAFISTVPLTGFDNTDAVSGEPTSEVFIYDAGSGELSCSSCSPAEARPRGRLIEGSGNSGRKLWTAASIPAGENQLYTPRALTADGDALFFTAYTDLLPLDRNGVADVYEWEAVGTSASCKDEDDPDFYAVNEGCLFLISSGSGDRDSVFIDSSASGRDVFFTTQDSLVSSDPGLFDLYDAREGGGFAPPPPPPQPCQGEACQPFSPPPTLQAPGSSAAGPGNPKPRCPKGTHRVKRKGKAHCVRNSKPKKHHKRQGKKGRTSR